MRFDNRLKMIENTLDRENARRGGDWLSRCLPRDFRTAGRERPEFLREMLQHIENALPRLSSDEQNLAIAFSREALKTIAMDEDRRGVHAERHADRRRQMPRGDRHVLVRRAVIGRVASPFGQFVGNQRDGVIVIVVMMVMLMVVVVALAMMLMVVIVALSVMMIVVR